MREGARTPFSQTGRGWGAENGHAGVSPRDDRAIHKPRDLQQVPWDRDAASLLDGDLAGTGKLAVHCPPVALRSCEHFGLHGTKPVGRHQHKAPVLPDREDGGTRRRKPRMGRDGKGQTAVSIDMNDRTRRVTRRYAEGALERAHHRSALSSAALICACP